jgi:Leucine rich repeat
MKMIIILCALFSTISAINIECDYMMWSHVGDFGHLYTCEVKNITDIEDKSIETVSGTHLDGKSDVDVQEINFRCYLNNCHELDYIPENIHKHFPNFIGLLFDECKIKDLSGDELKNYANLESIVIYKSPLENIPGNLFQNNSKLKYLNFSKNKITKVGSNLLKGLDQLYEAWFGGNTCIRLVVDRYEDKSEMLALIEDLKELCPYPEDPTAQEQ